MTTSKDNAAAANVPEPESEAAPQAAAPTEAQAAPVETPAAPAGATEAAPASEASGEAASEASGEAASEATKPAPTAAEEPATEEPAVKEPAAPAEAASEPPADPAAAALAAAQQIAASYASEQPVIELGSVVVNDTVDPTAIVSINQSMINRHGLIAGATGTGKTRTLQGFAEQLSNAGIPVVMADIKGDLSGISAPGADSERVRTRAADTGRAWAAKGFPTEFLSLGTGGIGIPVRATIESFGPILLAKVLGLNATQESTLGLIFHWAKDKGYELDDLKDIRAVVAYLVSDAGKADLKGIGGVSAATAGVILRSLVNVESQGGDTFFGRPDWDINDLIRVDGDGRGVISLVELADQAANPALFSTFLMWLLAELFEQLPEEGDVEKPKLVFIFDEAHLLFADASKAFLTSIEQTVKLIRSKGVGIYFCTQLPTDIPNAVLSQLGARIQHALRAFTPEDAQALKKTVKTYPRSDIYDVESALTSLGTGEAIVTVLDHKGRPTPTAWTRIVPPESLMDTIGDPAVTAAAKASGLYGKYAQTQDRESAAEKIQAVDAQRAEAERVEAESKARADAERAAAKESAGRARSGGSRRAAKEDEGIVGQVLGNKSVRSFFRSAASAAGRELSRSLFGRKRR